MPISLRGNLFDGSVDNNVTKDLVSTGIELSPAEQAYLNAEPVLSADTDKEPKSTAPTESSTPAADSVCCRCGHDNKIKLHVDVSDEDKVKFRRAMLTDTRFTKVYELFGGDVAVSFRSLTEDEERYCHAMAVKKFETEDKNGLYPTSDDFRRGWADYRTLLAIQSLSRLGEMFKADDTLSTEAALKRAETEVYGKLMRQAPIRGQLRLTYHEFSVLVKNMEVRGYDPSFWQARAAGKN